MKTAKEWAKHYETEWLKRNRESPDLADMFRQAIDEATAPLKAEVERLSHERDYAKMRGDLIHAETVTLKAEVEWLKAALDAAKEAGNENGR